MSFIYNESFKADNYKMFFPLSTSKFIVFSFIFRNYTYINGTSINENDPKNKNGAVYPPNL